MTGSGHGARLRNVLFVQFGNPGAYPPVQNAATLLRQHGWTVDFIGVADRYTGSLRLPRALGDASHLSLVRTGVSTLRTYVRFALTLARHASRSRPALVYASDALVLPLAWLAAVLTRVPLVYHEHDEPGSPRSWMSQCIAKGRATLAKRAVCCIVPSEERGRRLRDHAGVTHVLVVPNYPLRRALSPRGDRRSGQPLEVLYHGSINATRMPIAVIDGLAQSRTGARLRMAGYETVHSTGHVQALLGRASELGIKGQVEFLGALCAADLAGLRAESDIGLALVDSASDDSNMHSLVTASVKVYEYMAAGLCTIVPAEAAWLDRLVTPGYAIAADGASAHSVARALRWCEEAPDRAQAIGLAAQAMVESQWNYERAFANVLDVIQTSLQLR